MEFDFILACMQRSWNNPSSILGSDDSFHQMIVVDGHIVTSARSWPLQTCIYSHVGSECLFMPEGISH